jgi:hypothetical protein
VCSPPLGLAPCITDVVHRSRDLAFLASPSDEISQKLSSSLTSTLHLVQSLVRDFESSFVYVPGFAVYTVQVSLAVPVPLPRGRALSMLHPLSGSNEVFLKGRGNLYLETCKATSHWEQTLNGTGFNCLRSSSSVFLSISLVIPIAF